MLQWSKHLFKTFVLVGHAHLQLISQQNTQNTAIWPLRTHKKNLWFLLVAIKRVPHLKYLGSFPKDSFPVCSIILRVDHVGVNNFIRDDLQRIMHHYLPTRYIEKPMMYVLGVILMLEQQRILMYNIMSKKVLRKAILAGL